MISYYSRPGNNQHGGVAIFARSISFLKPLDVERFCVPIHAEFCAAEVVKNNTVLVALYRSSSSGDLAIFKYYFVRLIDYLLKKFKYITLIGDINLDLNANTVHSRDICNILSMFGIMHLIKEPTRVTGNSSSCLDNILTNFEMNRLNFGTCNPHLADHLGIFVRIHTESANLCKGFTRTRFISRNKICSFASRVNEIEWDNNVFNLNCSYLAEVILDKLRNIAETLFPLKFVSNRFSRIRWFNDRLRQMRRELHQSKANYDKNNTVENWRIYCEIKKAYKRAIKYEKRNTYTSEICNSVNKAKTIWSIVNQERKAKNPVIRPDNISADDFNLYFSNVGNAAFQATDDTFAEPWSFLRMVPKSPGSFVMFPISYFDVKEAIFKLKDSSDLDYYCLNSFMVKASWESLIEPLTVLFNNCVNEGVWPDSLKITKIRPLHKKGDQNCPDNFRPIATIPVISKILEIIMKDRLNNYCENEHVFSDSQYGFRKNRSTLKALLSLVDIVVEGFDRGYPSNATLCDLSKAFDSVNTKILIEKLEYYGIRENMLRLFASYLSNRKQYVCLSGSESGLLHVENGVPQGSVLGPILFLIYINDLPYSVGEASCILFADDTTLITTGKNSNTDSLQLAKHWFNSNKLQLNQSKTQNILFSTDKWLQKSESKLLGVILDSRLNWSSHIDHLCSRLSSQIFCLRQLRYSLSCDTLRIVYYAIFHSHLTYGVTLWGNSNAANRVFVLQKAAVRSIDGALFGTHCLPLFKKFKIMPLPCIFIFETLLQVHRNFNKFQRHSDIHSYSTRHADNLIQPSARLRTTKLNKIDIRIYNHFIHCFKSANVTNFGNYKFHKVTKNFLLENCFYSVEEYFKWSNPNM